MYKFSPELHTPQTLAYEITALNEVSDSVRIVGSLGRGVIFERFFGKPTYEYDMRAQHPLHVQGQARDIDTIGLNNAAASQLSPFQVDASGFRNPYIDLVQEDTRWFLLANRYAFAEELEPDIMQVFEGETVYGIPARTLPPQTLIHLYGMKGQLRQKDMRTQAMLRAAIDIQPTHARLTDKVFEPFTALKKINEGNSYIRAQDIYRRHVPNSVRVKVVPLMQRIKKMGSPTPPLI